MISKFNKIYLYISEYLIDFLNVIKFNSYSPFEDKQKRIFYRLIILVHTIEKGLSLDQPRPLFGKKKISDLMVLLNLYDRNYSVFPLEMIAGTLSSYLFWHKRLKIEDEFLCKIEKWLDEINTTTIMSTGGFRQIENFATSKNLSYAEFLTSRFSCRAYINTIVSYDVIEKIIATAQSAPSQCNRQSVRVHCFQNKSKIQELLGLQAGSAGFDKLVNNLFIVTSELTAWGGAGQRNQAYVDGALYSMSLMNACQAFGVATCPLNLAILNKVEKKIKIAGNIHDRERLIMMIAFGYPVDKNLKAANSPRLSVNDVLLIH